MSSHAIVPDGTVYIITHWRRHRSLHTPDRILIVLARNGYLAVGSSVRIYIDGVEGSFMAMMGGLEATTQISHIRRAYLVSQPQTVYLSFSHHPRHTSYFHGHICIIHYAESEEDYEL